MTSQSNKSEYHGTIAEEHGEQNPTDLSDENYKSDGFPNWIEGGRSRSLDGQLQSSVSRTNHERREYFHNFKSRRMLPTTRDVSTQTRLQPDEAKSEGESFPKINHGCSPQEAVVQQLIHIIDRFMSIQKEASSLRVLAQQQRKSIQNGRYRVSAADDAIITTYRSLRARGEVPGPEFLTGSYSASQHERDSLGPIEDKCETTELQLGVLELQMEKCHSLLSLKRRLLEEAVDSAITAIDIEESETTSHISYESGSTVEIEDGQILNVLDADTSEPPQQSLLKPMGPSKGRLVPALQDHNSPRSSSLGPSFLTRYDLIHEEIPSNPAFSVELGAPDLSLGQHLWNIASEGSFDYETAQSPVAISNEIEASTINHCTPASGASGFSLYDNMNHRPPPSEISEWLPQASCPEPWPLHWLQTPYLDLSKHRNINAGDLGPANHYSSLGLRERRSNRAAQSAASTLSITSVYEVPTKDNAPNHSISQLHFCPQAPSPFFVPASPLCEPGEEEKAAWGIESPTGQYSK